MVMSYRETPLLTLSLPGISKETHIFVSSGSLCALSLYTQRKAGQHPPDV